MLLWTDALGLRPAKRAMARRLAAEVGDALDLAHSHNLVHRDVKPDNVLITREGQAKLTDLGLVKVEQHDLARLALHRPERFLAARCGEGIAP